MERVTFSNRGKQVVGNLFTPADANAGTAGPAIVVTHPFGAVKEQVSTLYAQLLTEQGFITLVLDAAYQGESGGEPHFTESPASRVEDIRCAVDFLTTRREVDPERIGALGICAGGGYTLNAAQTEHRIKAVAGVSSFDIGSARRSGIGGTVSPERRREILHEVGQQRTLEAEGEPIRYSSLVRDDPTFDVTHPETLPALYRDGYLCYTQIAPNERAMTEFVFTTYAEQRAFFPFADMQAIAPRPLLLIVGSEADTLCFSQDAYDRAAEPRELMIIDGASHIDLYHKHDCVPTVATKLAAFYHQHLEGRRCRIAEVREPAPAGAPWGPGYRAPGIAGVAIGPAASAFSPGRVADVASPAMRWAGSPLTARIGGRFSRGPRCAAWRESRARRDRDQRSAPASGVVSPRRTRVSQRARPAGSRSVGALVNSR